MFFARSPQSTSVSDSDAAIVRINSWRWRARVSVYIGSTSRCFDLVLTFIGEDGRRRRDLERGNGGRRGWREDVVSPTPSLEMGDEFDGAPWLLLHMVVIDDVRKRR